MTFDRALGLLTAGLATAVAVVAVLRYVFRRYKVRRRRERFEEHLIKEKGMGYDRGQRSVPHLMAHLAMTESEVLEAAFRSKIVRRVTSVDDMGHAKSLMFEYDDTDDLNRKQSKGGHF